MHLVVQIWQRNTRLQELGGIYSASELLESKQYYGSKFFTTAWGNIINFPLASGVKYFKLSDLSCSFIGFDYWFWIVIPKILSQAANVTKNNVRVRVLTVPVRR